MADELGPPDPVQETEKIIHERNSELQKRGELSLIPEPLSHLVSGAAKQGYSPGRIADQLTEEKEFPWLVAGWAEKPLRYVL